MNNILIALPVFEFNSEVDRLTNEVLNEISAIKNYNFEILLIDDSIEQNKSNYKISEVSYLSNSSNRGLGFSLKKIYSYFLNGNYQTLITMDSDGQHLPSKLPFLIKNIDKRYDIIICSRYHPNTDCFNVPFDRELLILFARSVIKKLAHLDLFDPVEFLTKIDIKIS